MTTTYPPLNPPHGVVLFDAEKKRYYSFDALAAAVWHLIQRPMTLHEIAAAVAERFDMDQEIAVRDLEGLLEKMATEGLVEVAPD